MLNVSAKRQIFNNRSRQNGNLTRIIYSEKKPIVKQKNYAILSFAVYQNHAETLSGISVSTTRHCNVVTTTNCASKIKWLQINFNVVIGLVLCILFDVKRACFPAQTPWSICARADTQNPRLQKLVNLNWTSQRLSLSFRSQRLKRTRKC